MKRSLDFPQRSALRMIAFLFQGGEKTRKIRKQKNNQGKQ